MARLAESHGDVRTTHVMVEVLSRGCQWARHHDGAVLKASFWVVCLQLQVHCISFLNEAHRESVTHSQHALLCFHRISKC
jgi:hypothetical protein